MKFKEKSKIKFRNKDKRHDKHEHHNKHDDITENKRIGQGIIQDSQQDNNQSRQPAINISTANTIESNTNEPNTNEPNTNESNSLINMFSENVFNSLPYAVMVTDMDKKFIFANKACCELYGLTAPDYVGQSCSICGTENCGTDACSIRQLEERNCHVTYPNQYQHKNFRVITSRLCDGNGQYIGYIITDLDITDLRHTEKQLKIKEERFRISMPYTSCGVFEYDPYEKTLLRDSSSNDNFEISNITYNFPETFIERGLLHPRSIEDFRNMFELLDRGEPYTEQEFAFNSNHNSNQDGGLWYRMAFTNIFDERGVLIKAVGISQDITRQKEAAIESEKERRELLREVNTDSLTGLYNRKYVVERVSNFLRNKGADARGALYMIDVDDFKLLNDNYGHQKGDEFLKRLAECMAAVFRKSDLLCRVGGDEFLVFADGMPEEVVCERARQLCRCVGEIGREFHREGDRHKTIGVSIGIALVGEEEADFDELYRYADKALYAAKSKGKNDYVVYGRIPR